MATSLKFSGATRVTEGENATVTVTRMGDLSKKLVVQLHSINSWGVYPFESGVRGDDVQNTSPTAMGGDGTGVITFLPGQSRGSISIATLNDGVSEGREVMAIGYNIYEEVNGMLVSANFGIDNSENPWPRDGESTIGPWVVMVDDPGYQGSAPAGRTPEPSQPVVSPSPNLTSLPFGIQTTIDNSVTTIYNDNSVTNNYVNSFNQDNSVNTVTTTNVIGSYNTDNSVSAYTLYSLLEANDYSIGKNVNGSGRVQGTEQNDLLTGGKKNDRLYGDLGNDELIGGKGRDRFYGGLGSNVFNAGTSSSKKDADRLYIEREGNAAAADIIEAIGKSDRVYIQGSTGNLDVRGVDGGLGIYDNDVLQAIYTGNNFNASTLLNQLVAA